MPSTDRGWIDALESTGTLPCAWSSFSVSCAPVWPLGSAIGFMLAITPIRKPPSRTSLPTTRFEPLAMSTFSSLVGTNGSPVLAL